MLALRVRNKRCGFTLVELLFVVMLIGILLAIGIPNFFVARENARAKACQHNLQKIQWAKEQWAMNNRADATSVPDWPDLVGPTLYLNPQPVCPSGGTYTIDDMGTYPTCSVGDNGTPALTIDDHISQ
ncbi:MAG: type II secretion system protein [Armatimonadetes bacterium]|nr:type II secretion system protein [Armatimonadota bacterium]